MFLILAPSRGFSMAAILVVDFTSYGAFKQSLTGVILIKFCEVYFMYSSYYIVLRYKWPYGPFAFNKLMMIMVSFTIIPHRPLLPR